MMTNIPYIESEEYQKEIAEQYRNAYYAQT